MDRKTVSVRIDPLVWKEVKKYALERDMSVGKVLETAILQLMRR